MAIEQSHKFIDDFNFDVTNRRFADFEKQKEIKGITEKEQKR
jgi:hypothetical protein